MPVYPGALQDCPRHLKTPLRRLIGISRRANGNLLSTLDLFQFRSQKRRRLLLDKNLSFELHAVAQFHELVGIARIAILAGELAAAIRIDGPGKGKIAPAHHPIEQRSRPQREVLDVVPFAERLTSSRNPRDADQLRRRLEIREQRMCGHRRWRDSPFVRLSYPHNPNLSNPN